MLWKVLAEARKSWRAMSANNADHVLGQAQEPNSLSILTLPAAPVPNYESGLVADISADHAATQAPASGVIMATERWGRVAYFWEQTAGTPTIASAKLWVEAGKDQAGASGGWILAATLAVTIRTEAFVDIGQRRSYLEIGGYAGPGTLKLRMAPVA